jgi:hypothetical protein
MGQMSKGYRLNRKMVRRLAEGFLYIEGLDERGKLILAGRLANVFMRESSMTLGERQKYLDDFMFHVGEMADDLARMHRLLSDPGASSDATCKDALEHFFWHAANHVHAAAALYHDWCHTYLVPVRKREKKKARGKK